MTKSNQPLPIEGRLIVCYRVFEEESPDQKKLVGVFACSVELCKLLDHAGSVSSISHAKPF